MFWGEEEFETIATMAPASGLPHVWPASGVLGFEMDSWWKALIVALSKLVCISFTVGGGFRGGFIFPFFATGAAMGRVLEQLFPALPIQLATLCFAAGINVAITRTSLATTLILSFLAGEPCTIPAILMASLCSLFATSYMKFLKTQIARSDIDNSLYHHKEEHDSHGDDFIIDSDEE
jgi:H+/Cl- antiporter ClcA